MTRNASTNARRTMAALLALFSLLWLLPASTTLAHSKLLRTSPAAGSILAAPPTEIQLFLSESVGLEFSSLTLYDRARREQPLGPLRRVGEDDTTVSAAVLGPVPSGTYTVVWRVLSGVDGHLTAGSFAFRVRASDAAGTSGTPEPEEPVTPIEAGPQTPFEGAAADPDPLRWAIRGIILAGSVLLLGVPLLALLIVEPTVRERDLTGSPLARIVDKRGGRLGAVTAVVVLVALVIDLVLQVAEIGASGISQALGRGDLALLVINTTRYGVSWAVKVAASTALAGIMLAIWLRRRPGGHSLWEISVAAASLLLLAQSLGSHAAASNAGLTLLGVPLPVVTDWLHLVTVGAWVGGLGYMALVLFPALRASGLSGEERRAFLGRLIPRFSTLAIISVSLLAATGLYSVIVHSTDLSAILGSEYGQVLALKIALFVLLIIVGGVNLRRLTPLLKARPAGRTSSPHLDNSANVVNVPDAGNVAEAGSWGERELGPVRRLGRNVRLEVVLSVFALLCAGGLTLLPPPSGTAPGTLAASPVEQPTMSPLEPPETAVASSSPVPQDPGALPTPGPATAASTAGGYNFSFTIVPSIEGDDVTLDIGRSIAASPPLTDVAKVLFKVTPQDVDAGSTSYEAQRLGDAGPAKQTWHAREAILTIDGAYMVTAVVQRTQSPDLRVAFRLDLSLETGLRASAAEVVDISISTEPSPPKNGIATLFIKLLDGNRAPIENAKVAVSPYMPAHAHVEPQTIAQPVPGQSGVYTTTVQFDMGGSWLFIFNVGREGQPSLRSDASLEVIGPTATPKTLPLVITPTPAGTQVPLR